MSLLLLIVAVVVQMGKGGLPIIIVVFVIMIMMSIIMIAVVGIAVPASPLLSLPASLPSPIQIIACARVVHAAPHRRAATGRALLKRAWGTSILTAFSRIL